jgi:hypothetical protein
MTELKKYIKIFHKLSLVLDSNFQDIPYYFDRLQKYNNMSIELQELKDAFKKDYAKNKKLRDEYRHYMNENKDFVFFTNALVSTPDVRKFDGVGRYMPFVAYIYQILLWEFSQHFGVTLSKSRDIGASYTLDIGAAMLLCVSDTLSALFMSKTENDVDITGDRLQTNMGRVRQVIDSTVIYDLKKFQINKYLNLFVNEKCGIKGSSTTATAGTGGRFQYAFIDESGVIKNLEQILRSITYSVARTHIVGTFKSGSDSGLRAAIKDAHRVDIDKYIEMYKFLIVENDFDYRKTIDFIIADLGKEVPKGKNITFKITYKHHPLKKGNCDYHTIESNRLLNDQIAIALELEADETVGSPDRTFYNCQSQMFLSDKDFKNAINSNNRIFFGIDPGSIHSACICPIIETSEGIFIDKTELMTIADYNSFLEKMREKYKPEVVYVEKSAFAYSKSGYGWFVFLQKHFKNVIAVDNQHIDTQLLIINAVLAGNSGKKIYLHEDNKWWAMSYVSGAKYTDVEQKKMSHHAEAFICAIYQENQNLINDNSIFY